MAEQFLKHVIAFESAPMVTDFDQLTADGTDLPEPESVPDSEVKSVLWRVIVALSKHQVFLARTNHLSDRELYSTLWHSVLREEHALLSDGDSGAWHVDIPGDDPAATSYLTYYADADERERWRREYPGVEIPAARHPAYDRDRFLPVRAD
jgi:hypothetical protein